MSVVACHIPSNIQGFCFSVCIHRLDKTYIDMWIDPLSHHVSTTGEMCRVVCFLGWKGHEENTFILLPFDFFR